MKHILDSEGHSGDNSAGYAPQMRIQLISKGHDKAEVQKRFDNISKILLEEISRLKGEIVEIPK